MPEARRDALDIVHKGAALIFRKPPFIADFSFIFKVIFCAFFVIIFSHSRDSNQLLGEMPHQFISYKTDVPFHKVVRQRPLFFFFPFSPN